MVGVIISFFTGGHGFVKLLSDSADRWSTTGNGIFFHLDDSPNMPDEIQRWQDIVGTVVDFELVPMEDYREKAVNLTPVKGVGGTNA